MSDRPSGNNLQPTDTDIQSLYTSIRNLAQTESTTEVLDNFRRLFIEGREYKDPRLRSILEKIVLSKQAERDFKIILYQSCQILIDYWYLESQSFDPILALIGLFENLPSSSVSASRRSSRWLQLVKNFSESEQYFKLKRFIRAIALDTNEISTEPLGDLINRYPFLYKHCLLDEDSRIEYQRTVRKMRSRNQRNCEVALAQYLTYRARLVQVARARQLSTSAGKLLRRVENPTLLDDDEIKAALKQCSLKNHTNWTAENLSIDFLTNPTHKLTYKTFKDNLYQYLIAIVDSEYGKRRFNKQLFDKLQEILPDCHSQKLSEFLILRTYTQLLNFLVVESPQNLNHSIFVDIIANLGTTQTAGFFLKLVLLYPKIKPHFENRLSLLFEYYEKIPQKRIDWLIKFLENLQIAFSITFGSVDLSALKLYSEVK
ncbi:MAG: hypothetical protein MUD14_09625 [Hydrococcus sp. Prado102]|jgi:hypothetical protein|nr:hypothetical protein [Hydrococcus sp. Prado102]